jgi:GntR family transcriptional regulator
MSEKIAAQMRADILSGELHPGTRLPSIGDLAKKNGVAVSTMQRALGILKDESLLTSQPGVAVQVRGKDVLTIRPDEYMKPADSGKPYAWITQAARRGQTGANRIVDVSEVRAPRRVAAAYGLPEGGTVIARARVGLLDNEPAEYAVSYYQVETARGTRLADRRRIPGGSPTLLATLGLPLRGQHVDIATRVATVEEYELLELPGNPPVLEAFCVAFTDDQKPVEVTVLIKPGHLFRMGFTVSA